MASLMEIRRVILDANCQLPPMYKPYDYIQCGSRQARFDTGVNGNDETLVFDFGYMSLKPDGYGYRGNFGNQDGEDKRCWRLITSAATDNTKLTFTALNRRAGASSSIQVVSGNQTSAYGVKMQINLSYGRCSIVNEYGWSQTVTTGGDGTQAVSSFNIAIGSTYSTSTNTDTSNSCRFYGSFKIWSQGTLIRDYRPCVRVKDGKAGFYDMVNHTFNPSTGSLDFVAGND